MTWYPDLSQVDYFPVADPSALRAVGWLEQGKRFNKGRVSDTEFRRLCELLVDPWSPFESTGCHRCGLCRSASCPVHVRVGELDVVCGATNLFVPGRDIIYVAPSLIAHYIEAHGYRPPDEFFEAVRHCPAMSSIAYARALAQVGGRGLVAPRTEA